MPEFEVSLEVKEHITLNLHADTAAEAQQLAMAQINHINQGKCVDVTCINVAPIICDIIPVIRKSSNNIVLSHIDELCPGDTYFVIGAPYVVSDIRKNNNHVCEIYSTRDNIAIRHKPTILDPFGPFRIRQLEKNHEGAAQYNITLFAELESEILPLKINFTQFETETEQSTTVRVSINEQVAPAELKNWFTIAENNGPDKEDSRLRIYPHIPKDLTQYGVNMNVDELSKIATLMQDCVRYVESVEKIFYQNRKTIEQWFAKHHPTKSKTKTPQTTV